MLNKTATAKRGTPKPTSLQIFLRELTFRAAPRLTPADAASLVIALVGDAAVKRSVCDRHIASLAAALSDEPEIVNRMLAQAPPASAARAAAEQFINRGALEQLPSDSLDGMTDLVSKSLPLMIKAVRRSPAANAAEIGLSALGRVSSDGVAQLAMAALQRLPGESAPQLAATALGHAAIGEATRGAIALLLRSGGVNHVSDETLDPLVGPLAGRASFVAAFLSQLASDADFPAHLVQKLTETLAGAHPHLVQESLSRASPDFKHRAESYSQEGEDIVLARLFGDRTEPGYFVDVGAHHPMRYSNTYLLYKRGWCGINIDATPGAMAPFNALRPRDINLECLVSADRATHTYYMFNEPALNTLSKALADERTRLHPQYKIIGTAPLVSRPLSDLLDEHLPPGQTIDLLTVDVEGADLDVLRSNDWTRYHPSAVVAELLDTDLAALESHEIAIFLRAQGYRPLAKQFNSVVFQAAARA